MRPDIENLFSDDNSQLANEVRGAIRLAFNAGFIGGVLTAGCCALIALVLMWW